MTDHAHARASGDVLEAQLRQSGDPSVAVGAAHYLKSKIPHAGVRVPQVRAIVRDWVPLLAPRSAAQVILAAMDLWDRPLFECRQAAVELLAAERERLGTNDLWLCADFAVAGNTWALTDSLAAEVAWWVLTEPGATRAASKRRMSEEGAEQVWRWIRDPQMWVRRLALISQLPIVRSPHGDPELFLQLADTQLADREQFIRKAIGWDLRALGRHRPELVAEWLTPRLGRASTLTFREGTRSLPEPLREELDAARLRR